MKNISKVMKTYKAVNASYYSHPGKRIKAKGIFIKGTL